MSIRSLGVVVCLAAAVAAARADQVGSFHRSYTVAGPVNLQVATGSGSIAVSTAPGNAVSVDAVIRADDSFFGGASPEAVRRLENNPPITQVGNTIIIHSLREWANHLSVSYVITTPADTALVAHSGSGRITVGGLQRDVELGAGSGTLEADGIGGSLRAQTGSGGIRFDRVGGEAWLSTGSGSIRGNEVVGRLSATSGSGHIRVQRLDAGGDLHTASGGMELDAVAGDLTARAASGDIRVDGELTGAHHWRFSTASGDITVTLPQSTRARVRIQTASGGISVDHPTQRQSSWGHHSWEGVIGPAGAAPEAELVARAASGDVRVR
jgi:hypothetical protein